jgi:hypothetical protein
MSKEIKRFVFMALVDNFVLHRFSTEKQEIIKRCSSGSPIATAVEAVLLFLYPKSSAARTASTAVASGASAE